MTQAQPSAVSSKPVERPVIRVRSYQPEDHTAMRQIFEANTLEYLDPEGPVREYWVRLMQQALGGDLDNIEQAYFQSGGHFWIATATFEDEGKADTVVVGLVALEATGNGAGEVRRMSVHSDYQRYGIGRLLISTLEQWAASNGFRKIELSTASMMVKAQKFYRNAGFTHVETKVASTDPFVAMEYFEKQCALTAAVPAITES